MKGYGGYEDPWGQGGGYGQAAAEPSANVQAVWITLRQASQITAEGFPPEAPALTYDKAATLFSSAHHILQELVGDISAEVQIVHDPDWEQFPEVVAAVREAGAQDNCVGIATCPNEGKWAVGLAGGWQGRERAAKAALALSIAAGTDRVAMLAANYPEFASLCVDAGILPAGCGAPSWSSSWSMSQGKGGGGGKGGGNSWGGGGNSWGGGGGKGGGGKQQQMYEPEPSMPMAPTDAPSAPPVCWLTVDLNSKLAEAGFPPDGPAASYDKTFGEAFRTAHHVLAELVGGDVSGSVQFTHDPDWAEFPEVGKALKDSGAEENCFCVATVPAAGKWAVGLANGWKNREAACKLSLCLALANDEETFSRICMGYPHFGAYCAYAGLVPSDQAQKKRKIGELVPDGGMGSPMFGAGGCFGNGMGKGGGLPGSPLLKDSPLWITVPTDKLKEPLTDFPRECMVVGSDGASRQDLYDCVDLVLAKLLGDPEADVHYFDDPNCDQFPQVGEALKVHGDAKEQLMVAVCAPAGTWAAGFGPKWKSRQQAAKVALAATLAMRAAETGQIPDLSNFTPFAAFIAEVTLHA